MTQVLFKYERLAPAHMLGEHEPMNQELVAVMRGHPSPAISHLALGGHRLSLDAMSQLSTSLGQGQHCLHLLSIDMAYAKLTTGGLIVLAAALPHNCSLRRLSLCGCGLSDEAVQALARVLRDNKGLHALDLSANGVGNLGALALAKTLQTNTSLRELALANNEIGAAGGHGLLRALHTNRSLGSLNIESNPLITPEVGAALFKLFLARDHWLHLTFNGSDGGRLDYQRLPESQRKKQASPLSHSR